MNTKTISVYGASSGFLFPSETICEAVGSFNMIMTEFLKSLEGEVLLYMKESFKDFKNEDCNGDSVVDFVNLKMSFESGLKNQYVQRKSH